MLFLRRNDDLGRSANFLIVTVQLLQVSSIQVYYPSLYETDGVFLICPAACFLCPNYARILCTRVHLVPTVLTMLDCDAISMGLWHPQASLSTPA